MKPIAFVTMETGTLDLAVTFQNSLLSSGVDFQIFRIPYQWDFTVGFVEALRFIIGELRRQGFFVVLFTASAELFLQSDFRIGFSGYRRWHDNTKGTIIPHVWGPINPPDDLSGLIWKEKPPFRISFMGTNNASSKMIRSVSNLPQWAKNAILAGHHLRSPLAKACVSQLVSLQQIFGFSRNESLTFLKVRGRPEHIDVIERQSFSGSNEQLLEYVNHLENSTYVFCPRGTENYSYRTYEALSYGRIPVIIDTDMVLPPELEHSNTLIRIPFEKAKDCYDIVKNDFESRSTGYFLERQHNAFQLSRQLRSKTWADRIARQIIQAM